MTLSKWVVIQGTVRHEDGTPVPHIQLRILGKNFGDLGEHTNHAGNFSYNVNAGNPITVVPVTESKQPLVAPAIYLESVGDGTTPVPQFDFVLKKGTKLFGRMDSPETGKAIPNAYIRIYENRLPNESLDGDWSIDEHYARADSDGNYSVQLPLGKYRLKIDDHVIPEPLVIKDEEEIRQDFWCGYIKSRNEASATSAVQWRDLSTDHQPVHPVISSASKSNRATSFRLLFMSIPSRKHH